MDALKAVLATGAAVACAVSFLDRGGFDGEPFAGEGVPYLSLLTHADVGIPAIGTEPGVSAATT